MSLPFFCHAKKSGNKFLVYILQFMKNSDQRWSPLDDIVFESRKITLNNNTHCIIYDKFICENDNVIKYKKNDIIVDVKYFLSSAGRNIGFYSNGYILPSANDVKISNIDILVHLGNQINIKPIYKKYTTGYLNISDSNSAICDAYINNWNNLNMNNYQNIVVPGKNECGSDIGPEFYEFIRQLNDTFSYYINGESRSEDTGLYCHSLDFDDVTVEIMSNWAYRDRKFVNVSVEKLTEDYLGDLKWENSNKHLVLAYTDNIIKCQSFMEVINLLKPKTLTVIFGTLLMPFSYKITENNVSYEMHCCGSLNYVDNYHSLSDFKLKDNSEIIQNYDSTFITSYLKLHVLNDSVGIERISKTKNIVDSIKETCVLLHDLVFGV